MHIAINGWFWDSPHVGSGQYLRGLLSQLVRLAPEARFSLIVPQHATQTDSVPPSVHVVSIPAGRGHLGKVFFEQRGFPQAVRAIGADIAHIPYWGPPLSSPAPMVTSVLDVIPLIFPEYARGFRARLYTSLVSAAARGSAHILTLSETSKADIIKYLNIPETQITATHLAADERFHPQLGAERDEAVREKYGLPDQFVLHLNGFDRRKQVNELLYAYTFVAQAQPDVPLVLGGKEPDWNNPLFPNMREYARQLDLEDHIIWAGYIDEEDKPSLYRLASVYVNPSAYEGFGLPLLEAMASGTPVVAFNTEVFNEIAGEGAYLVENTRSMAGAIIALLVQEPLREAMITQGLARATNFSWRNTARQTLDVYEQVLQQNR
ncbi:MAG: glycosyltransferase family 1 protein [Chloroflexi bacterium]|nr:MAG: glycosyltransferase family 1 protein [Chloroflexota bacterium]